MLALLPYLQGLGDLRFLHLFSKECHRLASQVGQYIVVDDDFVRNLDAALADFATWQAICERLGEIPRAVGTVAKDRDVAFAIAHPDHERLAFTATGIAIVIVPETDDPITIRPTSLW